MQLFKLFPFAIISLITISGCSPTTEFEKPESYSLSVSTNLTGGGSVFPTTETYDDGTEVSVEANANQGYAFLKWSGDQESTENPYTFTINEDTELIANFTEQTQKYNFSVSVNPSEGGSVNLSDSTYEDGSEVTVTATPNQGWTFTKWTGDQNSTDNPFTFTMNENINLTANFEGQRSNYTVELQVTDAKDTLNTKFGQLQNATKQFDEDIDEEAPPPPPEGNLHAYFEIPDYDLFQDFRDNYATQVEWSLVYQLGSEKNLTLNWAISNSSEMPGNLLLTNESNSFEIDMKKQDTHTINNSDSGNLVITYNIN